MIAGYKPQKCKRRKSIFVILSSGSRRRVRRGLEDLNSEICQQRLAEHCTAFPGSPGCASIRPRFHRVQGEAAELSFHTPPMEVVWDARTRARIVASLNLTEAEYDELEAWAEKYGSFQEQFGDISALRASHQPPLSYGARRLCVGGRRLQDNGDQGSTISG